MKFTIITTALLLANAIVHAKTNLRGKVSDGEWEKLDRKLQDYFMSWGNSQSGGSTQYIPPTTIISKNDRGSAFTIGGEGAGGSVGGTSFGLGGEGFATSFGGESGSGGDFSFGSVGNGLRGGWRKLQDFTSTWREGGLGGKNQFIPPKTITTSSTGIGSATAVGGSGASGLVSGFTFGAGGPGFKTGDPGDNSRPSGLFGSTYGQQYFGGFGFR
mmetsp:Transcript_22712/g.33534  ORF Transcript_22712/g.33534 Transcript_22712/m.33534 type:complete len:215 (-) Transcript_22712:71-715(-)|eukprot:CAMPEP_0194214192 /NCGR_PEP_ID=MMETSP0156-20130528/15330_1 /TAXON_ID=33649 /ORGANISM="Thalassionema nitzschioides, Strain L26-B" /LENGTH=214 /DNA_ID=CAMNT_0038942411 /DNA_START=99 /DNA_END=743 /DNA_ORIENTATION=-